MFESPTNLTGMIIQQAAIGAKARRPAPPAGHDGSPKGAPWLAVIRRLFRRMGSRRACQC
jgi:hypothetical protein